jgi:hypothetical protein
VATIDSVLAETDRAWRAYGVGSAQRQALGADLRLDLQAAVADGIDPAQLIGDDISGFARRLADEAGVRRPRQEYGRLLGTALAGAALGGALGFVVLMVLYPLFVRVADIPRSIEVPVQVAVAVYYGVPAAVVIAGAVIAVRLRLRDLPQVHGTARWMSLLLPLTGIVITPVTMAFAWTTGYSDALPTVLAEVGLVLGTLAGATILARRLSLRSHQDANSAPVATGGVRAA